MTLAALTVFAAAVSCLTNVAELARTTCTSNVEQTLREDAGTIDFTPRQREILCSLCRGLTNQDMSRQFGISLAGIKYHLATIFRKLNAANRSDAISTALRKHLLKI